MWAIMEGNHCPSTKDNDIMKAFDGKKNRFVAAAAALIVAVGLSACSDGDAAVESTTESTTPTSSHTSESSTPGSSSSESSATDGADVEVVPNKLSQQDTTTAAPHMGYTDSPDGTPTPIHKTISRCAKRSDVLYEPGTTWFTDGTSGWTQYCFDSFNDIPPPAYESPEPQPPADEPVYGTSGEAQTAAGCEEGYIDPETCAYYGF